MTTRAKQSDETPRRGPTHPGVDGQLVIMLVVFDALLAGWITTQVLASRMDFHPSLGPVLFTLPVETDRPLRAAAVIVAGTSVALFVRTRSQTAVHRRRQWSILLSGLMVAAILGLTSVGPVYAPHRALAWTIALRHTPTGKALADESLRTFGTAFIGLLAVTLAVRPRRTRQTPSHSHGSALWGSGESLSSPTGLELGRLGDRVLRYTGEGHLITVAPTRTGKGVGAVIPNLLRYPGSVVVTDPKGENYAVTARRRSELGAVVHALDPFGVVGGSDAFNPFDLIDADSPDANDDAWMLADMLVVTDGRPRDEVFWNDEARALIAGFILHVAASAPPELRTLPHVRTLLTLPSEQFQLLLNEMLESELVGGLVSRSAARLLQKADRERSGVISSAQSHTHFLDSPRMARVLASSTFELADLKRSNLSIYLILPPERVDTHRAWMRVITACCMLVMTRIPGPPRERVLFLLDEFASLGRMRPVERAISLAAAYGASFWLLLQDLAQLKGAYPEQWQTFIANADVLQTFGINDWETAEYISKMTGEATIHVTSENETRGVSRGKSTSRQRSAAETIAEKGRRLLLPDEVRRMRVDEELLFVRASEPVLARRLDYLRDPEYTGQSDPNPMHLSKGDHVLNQIGNA